MNELFAGIGRSFVVSSLVPASFFTLLAVFVTRPWLNLLRPTENNLGAFSESIVYLVITTFIGFALYSLNTSVYRLFEGYSISVPWFRRQHLRRLVRLLIKREILENLLARDYFPDKDLIRNNLLQIYEQLQRSYPSRVELVMPSALGNILRAYEEYPGLNYGIDGVLAWPHLLEVASQRFIEIHEENNNKVSFVLNSAILSLLLTILSIVGIPISLFQSPTTSFNPALYALAAVTFGILSWFFYHNALPLAEEQGYIFRAGFDLFRFSLLEKLRIKELPVRPEAEAGLWKSIQEYWWAGLRLVQIDTKATGPVRLGFEFRHDNASKDSSAANHSTPKDIP